MRVGIAGAGIMGRVLAWQLQGIGCQVSLFDKDEITHGSAAAYTAAGMLAPYSELVNGDSLIYALGQQGLALWPAIISSLKAQASFFQRGSLVVAHHRDSGELQHFIRVLQNNCAKEGGKHQTLNQAQLSKLEPALGVTFSEALQLVDESWLHAHEIMAALANELGRAGVNWHAQTEVLSLKGGKIVTAQQYFDFDWVIDCRGLGASKDIKGLRGVRGELIKVFAPQVNITRMVRLMHPRYRLYLVPFRAHQYVLGATQIESEDSSPISVRSALELLSALYSIDAGFAEARIIETKTNCRPALIDNHPLVSFEDRLIRVNGLFRHGFMLSPVLAKGISDFLLTENIGKSPFADICCESAEGLEEGAIDYSVY